MDHILQKLAVCEQHSNILEPNEDQRNLYLEELQTYTNAFINTTETRKAFGKGDVKEGSLAIDGRKKTFTEILATYTQEVTQLGINPASGGHLGYIPGGGIYASALADYLADITNEYAGMYFASPGAVTIENEVIQWLKKLFHFPDTSVGNLTSGGSIANLIALTAARDSHGIKGEKISRSVVYLSPQVHHCIHKALRIIGLEDVIIRTLALDEHFRIDPKLLSITIQDDKKNGLNPFMIIATAGTTDTGAIDPLQTIGEIAQQQNVWYHIDAAYGGFFILTETKKELFIGIEMADSLVIDPHKGLFLPYGTGAVLVKNKEVVFHSHHYTANYMQDAINENLLVNPADVSPELTKHFRGLRMWLPLQLYGIEPFIACLEEKLLLTQYFREQVKRLGFQIGPEPDLSVSYFWYSNEGMDDNQFNKKLMELIHQDGSVFLSSTAINGKFVIRMAILSFRTKKETIDKAIVMLEDCLLRLRKQ